jgi:hypothetical protein
MVHRIWEAVIAAMSAWHHGKVFIEHAIAIDHDALHVIVGVIAWVLFGLLTRRPLSATRPWLWLFALILWNETVDLWVEQWPDPGMQYGEGAKDVILTMLLPTFLMFAARWRPRLFAAGRGRSG